MEERQPTHKQIKLTEGLLAGKSRYQAAIEAGYTPSSAKSIAYKQTENSAFNRLYNKRSEELKKLAAVHTDEITGTLVEIMKGNIADLFPHSKAMKRAKKLGLDKIIKKVSVRFRKVGVKTHPDGTREDILKEEIDLEVYSKLDAISQLRDNFGMKQEPRANTYEAQRLAEVEKALDQIAAAEQCDRPKAAQLLKDALSEDSPLIPVVNKYLN